MLGLQPSPCVGQSSSLRLSYNPVQSLKIQQLIRRCPSLLSYCRYQHQGQSNLRMKRFILSYRLQSVIGGSQGKNLKHKPWRKNAYWLTPTGSCSGSFLTHPRPTGPGMVLPAEGWARPSQLTIMPNRHITGPFMNQGKFQLGFPWVILSCVRLTAEAN